MSSFLIEIVDNAAVNKMTVRNVGIVFAPTLNIPAPLISFFLTDYENIFGVPVDDTSPYHQEARTTGHSGDESRSPRQQTFIDMSTPAYTPAYNDNPFRAQVPLNQQQWNGRPPSAFPMNSAPSYPPPQPPQQQLHVQHAGYDPGFAPVRPTYDSPSYEQQYHGAEGYGGHNRQPPSAREQKQKRRESSMLLMNVGMGQRKGSNGSNPPRHREEFRSNPMLIREETAFD